MIKVLIADDHSIVRSLLQLMLERAEDIQVVAVASNGKEAVEKAVLYGPNVVILDVSMPVMDGVPATQQILADCPEAHVLMVSLHDGPYYIRRSVQAGAVGYLLKDVVNEELVGAVRSVHGGKLYFSHRIAAIASLFIQ